MKSRNGSRLAVCWWVVCWTLVASFSGPALAQDLEDPILAARHQASERLAKAEAASVLAQRLEKHGDFVVATSRDGQITARLTQGKSLLVAAQSALETAERRGTITSWKDAGALAGGALKNYEEGMARAQKVFRRLAAERAPPPPPPEQPPPEQPPPPQQPPSTPPVLEKGTEAEVAEGRTNVGSAEPAEGDSSTPAVESPRGDAFPAPRSSGSLPSSLVRGAELYFGGDYEGVLENLDPKRYRSKKARAHAHLLRAAAQYALFLLSRETDYGRRATAIEEIAACRRLATLLTPPAEFFSPRFREFFAATL